MPASAPPGASVTIAGSGFDSNATNNDVQFNGTLASVTQATPQQLQVVIPANATSGPITVTVGAYSVTSSNNFMVGTLGPVIASFAPQVVNANDGVSVSGSGFAGAQTVAYVGGIAASIISGTSTQITVAAPFGTNGGKIAVSTPFGTTTTTQDLFILPSQADPTAVGDLERVTIDGNTQSIHVAEAGGTAAVLIDAQAQVPFSFGISGTGLTGGSSASARVFAPNGAEIADLSFNSDGSMLVPSPPTDGTYLLVLAAPDGAGLDANITVSTSESGTLNLGVPITFVSTRPGQSGVYRFSVENETTLALSSFDATFAQASITISDANNKYITSGDWLNGPAGVQRIPNLQPGAYNIVISPQYAALGSVSMLLMQETTGNIAVDGDPTSVALQEGQSGSYTFTADAGDHLGLGVTNFQSTDANTSLRVSLLDTNGRAHFKCVVNSPNSCYLGKFATGGSYSLIVVPTTATNANLSLQLSQAVTRAVTVDGTAVLFSTTRVGQPAVISFAASASNDLSVKLFDNTFPRITANVYDGNGHSVSGYYPLFNQTETIGVPN